MSVRVQLQELDEADTAVLREHARLDQRLSVQAAVVAEVAEHIQIYLHNASVFLLLSWMDCFGGVRLSDVALQALEEARVYLDTAAFPEQPTLKKNKADTCYVWITRLEHASHCMHHRIHTL